MRRVTTALAISALLLGACGEATLPRAVADDLQGSVDRIRLAVETGQVVTARVRLERLAAEVTSLLERGVIDQRMALGVLESAEAVRAALRLVPSPSPTERPSPSPTPEEGNGDGKGKDKGHGDEGDGND
jgi:hypothetical protein